MLEKGPATEVGLFCIYIKVIKICPTYANRYLTDQFCQSVGLQCAG
jgi:hypothetical protein